VLLFRQSLLHGLLHGPVPRFGLGCTLNLDDVLPVDPGYKPTGCRGGLPDAPAGPVQAGEGFINRGVGARARGGVRPRPAIR
jgi:hypothetical protein